MKIVCDTNVLISGILFGGHARQILNLSSMGRVTNFISEPILAEVEDVLSRPKFKLTPSQVSGIIALFRDTFELTYPSKKHKVIEADPDDDLILDAAVEADAGVIISGDSHLRNLGKWKNIRILTPADFISEHR